MLLTALKENLKIYRKKEKSTFPSRFGLFIDYLNQAEQIILLEEYLTILSGDTKEINYEIFISWLPDTKKILFNHAYLNSKKASAQFFKIWIYDEIEEKNEAILLNLLPEEMWVKIAENLNKYELRKLGQVCKYLYIINKINYPKAYYPPLNYRRPLLSKLKTMRNYQFELSGKITAVIELNNGILIVGTDAGEILHTQSYFHNRNRYSAIFDSKIPISCLTPVNHYTFLSGHINGLIYKWDLKRKEKIAFLGHAKQIQSMVIRDRKEIISTADDKSLITWNLHNGRMLRKIKKMFSEPTYIDITHKHEIITRSAKSVFLWENSMGSNGKRKRIMQNFLERIKDIKVFADNTFIVGINHAEENIIYLMRVNLNDVNKPLYLEEIKSAHLVNLAILPNEDVIYTTRATTLEKSGIFIIDGKTGKIKCAINGFKQDDIPRVLVRRNGSVIIYSESTISNIPFSALKYGQEETVEDKVVKRNLSYPSYPLRV